MISPYMCGDEVLLKVANSILSHTESAIVQFQLVETSLPYCLKERAQQR